MRGLCSRRKRLKPRRLRFWRGSRLRPPELRVPATRGWRRVRVKKLDHA